MQRILRNRSGQKPESAVPAPLPPGKFPIRITPTGHRSSSMRPMGVMFNSEKTYDSLGFGGFYLAEIDFSNLEVILSSESTTISAPINSSLV